MHAMAPTDHTEMEDSNINSESVNGEGENGHFSNINPLHVSSEEDDVENLKKTISNHPLYGFLIQAHLNCLKVGLVEVEVEDEFAKNRAADNDELINSNISTSSPELDHFMEGYCKALKKLREAIEEPVEETASFIKAMYTQLNQLNSNTNSCGPSIGFPKSP